MKWSLNELRQAGSQPIAFEEQLDVTSLLKSRLPELIDMTKAKVSGLFSVDSLGVLGYAKVEVSLTLPSTRSLEPAQLTLSFDLTEHYVSHHEHDLSRFDDDDVVIVLDEDILDLNEVVVDNILLHIPMQILTEAERTADQTFLEGDDWQVVSEARLEEIKKEAKPAVDPRLAKLGDFFKED